MGKLGIMTPQEVAEELQTSTGFIISALETRKLKGIETPDGWRTTADAVRKMIENPEADMSTIEPNTTSTCSDKVAEVKGVPTLKQLAAMQWNTIEPFKHLWPAKKGEVRYEEAYDEAFALSLTANGKPFPLVIAAGYRKAAGEAERRRIVIFRADTINGKVRSARYPTIEFTGGNAFGETGIMASIIYGEGRSQVPVTQPVPAGYADMPIGVFNQIVSGPYASSNRCVVAHYTDFPVMARHAMLRCQQKGWL